MFPAGPGLLFYGTKSLEYLRGTDHIKLLLVLTIACRDMRLGGSPYHRKHLLITTEGAEILSPP